MSIVIVEHKENYSILSINRPKYYNALNEEVLEALNEEIESIQSRSNSRVLILTGSDDKSFIAGADIKAMNGMDKEKAQIFCKMGQDLTQKIEKLDIPVIAAINGFALGGGCEVAMSCHIRYAADTATFGQPEVALGLIAGFGGTQRLPKLVGKGKALELLLSGKKITAHEAESIGLVNKVYPFPELMPAAEELAIKIAKNSPLAIKKTIGLVNKSFDTDIDSGLKEECLKFSDLFGSYDTEEGLSAFIQKRAPIFKGK